MREIDKIWSKLEEVSFQVGTDTRKNLEGKIFFALQGENFDGNNFVKQAFQSGASGVVCSDKQFEGLENSFVVENTTKALQEIANKYRKKFNIPIIAIGGSNGKTTSRELTCAVLNSKFNTHTSEGNFNNHIGLPLSILTMNQDSELAVFEIGANHTQEHTELLKILEPTHVLVTNNGLDHLEGFGSPLGARKANKEIFDWAKTFGIKAFVNNNHQDLLEDSKGLERILYPDTNGKVLKTTPLEFELNNAKIKTHLFGSYNLENIYSALAIGKYFGIKESQALDVISKYQPKQKRSQMIRYGRNVLIVDCYNANPSSTKLALESFLSNKPSSLGVILGDMLELGDYAHEEHKKILKVLNSAKLAMVVLIGPEFKKALNSTDLKYNWFEDSLSAKQWLAQQDLGDMTILLKGSRGVRVEEVFDLSI